MKSVATPILFLCWLCSKASDRDVSNIVVVVVSTNEQASVGFPAEFLARGRRIDSGSNWDADRRTFPVVAAVLVSARIA